MDPIRRLVYQFLELPFEVRMRIVRKLGLVQGYDGELSDKDLFIRMFLRAWEKGLFNALHMEVGRAHKVYEMNIEAMTDQEKETEIIARWNKVADRILDIGIDLSAECRNLGHYAAYKNRELDVIYVDYEQLCKFICTQVDIINNKIVDIDPKV